jgi:transcriptional regulator with XRE-family HTH domain
VEKTEFVREFGLRVRAAREAMGISQEELAERATLHRTAISHIELASRSSTLETVEKLARALQVQPAELMPTIALRRGK